MDRKDGEFRLEILRVQLKYRRMVAESTSFMTWGVSSYVFAAGVLITFMKENVQSLLWSSLFIALMGMGTLMMSASIARLLRLKSSEESDIENIREKFLRRKTKK